MKWTEAQQDAIEARGSNLLVSAAAGAGKTAVLVQRILSLVEQGVPVSALLVVTFTRAAASEMRERLMLRLHEAAGAGGPHAETFKRQALMLSESTISTLHGFCHEVLKMHFQAVEADPDLRVLDGEQSKTLREAAMEETLEQLYETASPQWLALDECYGEGRLAGMIEELWDFLMAQPDPWGWLEGAVAAYEAGEGDAFQAWLAAHARGLTEELDKAEMLLYQALALAQSPGGSEKHAQSLQADIEALQALQQKTGAGYEALREAVSAYAMPTAKTKEKEADADVAKATLALRNKAKAILKNMAQSLGESPVQRLAGDLRSQLPLMRGLQEAVVAFEQQYRRRKQERGCVDFGDLEHLALRAVSDPLVAEAVRDKYQYIFVDEYQDSSNIQEALINAIRREDNSFLVGDVKQSIYRFRQAKPDLFLEKYARFSPEKGALDRKIDLNQNFRSRPILLKAINQVFEFAMRGDVTEIEYDEQAHLNPGQAEREDDPPVELCLRALGEEQDDEAEDQNAEQRLEAQAAYVAQRIQALVGTALFDAKQGTARFLQYRDMVILMRAVTGKAYRVERVLQRAGIPVYSDVGDAYFELPEVRLVLALLQLVDNPMQDEALLAGLRGIQGGISDEGLLLIREATPEGSYYAAAQAYLNKGDALAGQLSDFFELLSQWRLRARYQPLAEVVEEVAERSGCYARAGALPGGRDRQANLRLLATRAAAFERNVQGGLSAFLREAEQLRRRGDTPSAKNLGEGEDVVRIMSMHKSKGLEFPVVFCLGLESKFSQKNLSSTLLCHDTLGLGLGYVDAGLRVKHRTLAQLAILAQMKREQLAEEVRLLYVAMTRAQDRLILVGDAKPERAQMLQSVQDPKLALRQSGSLLDLLLGAVMRLPQALRGGLPNEPTRMGAFVFQPRAGAAAEPAKPAMRELEVPQGGDWRKFPVVEGLLWKPPARQAGQSLKTSVTGEVEGRQEGGLPELIPAPAFLTQKEDRGAQVGSGWHALMRRLPLSELRALPGNGYGAVVLRCLDDLVGRGLMTEAVRASLRVSRAVDFLQSDLGRRLLASPEVRREWAFNLREELPGGGFRLVQGVLDCAFLEAGEWVVLDYKTDAGAPEDLVPRYQGQVAYYVRALEEITGRRVRQQVLYHVRSGESVEISIPGK